MIKIHNIELPELIKIDSPNGRVYRTPDGNEYPSITTVLSYNSNKQYLEEWKERVGEEEVNRVSKRATLRGTALHSYCEKYLLSEPFEVNIMDVEMFKQFKVVLEDITDVYAIERPLYSGLVKTAGTVDLIAKHNGKNKIIDWKTSKTIKSREDISDYFMQGAFYSMAYYYLTGVYISTIMIVMACDETNKPLIFEEPVTNWVKSFKELRTKYKGYKC